MEPKNEVLEDDFPFQLRDFLGSILIFRGVYTVKSKKKTSISPFSVIFFQNGCV